MGGGLGLSIHAPFRIATDRTLVSMPETQIGFFPDVGASFFLPRLEGFVGTYLALTSTSLRGLDAYFTGIATHYTHHSMLSSLTARLSELEFKDYDSLQTRLALVDSTIEEFNTGIPHDEAREISGRKREAIDRCFRFRSVEEIMQALSEEETKGEKDWAASTLAQLRKRSPTSLKVALKQMRIGLRWNISEAFQREFHIANHFLTHPDFPAGVSARLLHKPPTIPTWCPSTLEAVREEDVDKFFLVAGQERLRLVGEDVRWKEYPARFGLPSEADILRVVEQVKTLPSGKKSKAEQVHKAIAARTKGKIGVSMKVDEVLQRKCIMDEDGELREKI